MLKCSHPKKITWPNIYAEIYQHLALTNSPFMIFSYIFRCFFQENLPRSPGWSSTWGCIPLSKWLIPSVIYGIFSLLGLYGLCVYVYNIYIYIILTWIINHLLRGSGTSNLHIIYTNPCKLAIFNIHNHI